MSEISDLRSYVKGELFKLHKRFDELEMDTDAGLAWVKKSGLSTAIVGVAFVAVFVLGAKVF